MPAAAAATLVLHVITVLFISSYHTAALKVICLNHLYTVKLRSSGATLLRTRGQHFKLPAVRYVFNKRNFIVCSPFKFVWFRLFTARHGMQTRSCDENSVCPSVCLSVKRVHCDKTEEKYVVIFIPYHFNLVFCEEKWLVRATPSTGNLGSKWPRWRKIADFRSIFARSASAVAPSEKKFNYH